MALSKENLSQLIALQERDSALDKQKAEIDRIPVEAAALRAELEKEKARMAEAKTLAISLEKKKKEKELELAQKEEAVRKHGTELNQVKTNDAFKALQHEIEQAKAQGSQIETEILEIMETLDARRRDDKALAAEVAAAEKRISAALAALDARLAELKGLFEAAKAERDQAAAPVPTEAMRIYDHVRSRGKLDAIVAIDGTRCSACNITLAPQVIVEATKAKALVACESCQRILYRREAPVAKA
jgi:predicted  nucleic acid-binding Zn-ribbon protein